MGKHHPRGALRNLAEYAGLRLAQAIFQALPERSARRFGRFMADLGWWLDARHRRVATANVEVALGVPPARARRIARGSFGHMGEMLAEMAWAPRLIRDPAYLRRFELTGAEALRTTLAAGRGAVLCAAHLGNWELTSFLFPLSGLPLTTVARPLDNPRLDALLIARRRLVGQGIIYKAEAAKAGAQLLRAGGRILALVCDQRAKKSSVTVPFLGRPALTTTGPAMLAVRTGAPLFVGWTARGPDGRHRFAVEPLPLPPARGDLRADLAAIMTAINDRLAAAIRRHPEQYLWAHDRWRPSRAADPA